MRGFPVLAATGIWAVGACYSYVPAELDGVIPGEEVRLTVTREAAERLQPALATSDRTLEGEVVRTEPGSLWLNVTTSRRQSGFQFERMGQTVHFDSGEFLDIELKTLHKHRTYAAVGTAAVAVAAIAWAALGGDAGGKKVHPPGDGVGDDLSPWRIPLLRVPFGIP